MDFRKKKTLKKVKLYGICSAIMGCTLGLATFNIVKSFKTEQNVKTWTTQANDLRQEVYSSYIVTDEYKTKLNQYLSNIDELYKNKIISAEQWREQNVYANGKEFVYSLVENGNDLDLQTKLSQAQTLEKQIAEKEGLAGKTFFQTLPLVLGFGGALGCMLVFPTIDKKNQAFEKENEAYDNNQKDQDALLKASGCKQPEVPENYKKFLK